MVYIDTGQGPASYVGVGGVARRIKNIYVGVNGVARKVTKGYVGMNKSVYSSMATDSNVARLWYSSAVTISYSGSYTDEIVTMGGSSYRLLTLTSSGTFTASSPVLADIWLCGGGGGGQYGGTSGSYAGNGGGGGRNVAGNGITIQSLTVTIGAGGAGGTSSTTAPVGNDSTISGNVTGTARGGNKTSSGSASIGEGGSGGGAGAGPSSSNGKAGSGTSKKPFGLDDYDATCAGGGGGAYNEGMGGSGGDGGSNGGNGGNSSINGTYIGGTGGSKGGGNGGNSSSSSNAACAGGNASYYGSGGGGGGFYYNFRTGVARVGDGGAGYQGVCFIRIPLE